MGFFGYLRRSRSRAKAVNDLPLEPVAEREAHRELHVSPASAATDDDSHPVIGPSARSDFDVDSSEVWQRTVAACIPLRITWSSEGGPPGTGSSAHTLLDCFLNLRVQYVCVDALRATPDLWSFMWLPAFCAFTASACNVYIFQGGLLFYLHLMVRGAALSYGYVLVTSAVLWRVLKQTKRAVTLVQLLATASYSLAPWLAYVLVPSLFWRVPSGVAQLSGVMHWRVTAAVLASTIFTILACHRLLERRKDMAGLDMDPRAPGSWYRDVTKYSRSGLPSPASLSAKRMLALCLCGTLALLLQIAFSNVLWFHLHSLSSASSTARVVRLREELSSIRTEFFAKRRSPHATKMSLSAMVNRVDRMQFGRNQIQVPRELKEDIIQLAKSLLPPSPPAHPSPSVPKTPDPLLQEGAIVMSKEDSKRFQQEMKLLKQQVMELEMMRRKDAAKLATHTQHGASDARARLQGQGTSKAGGLQGLQRVFYNSHGQNLGVQVPSASGALRAHGHSSGGAVGGAAGKASGSVLAGAAGHGSGVVAAHSRAVGGAATHALRGGTSAVTTALGNGISNSAASVGKGGARHDGAVSSRSNVHEGASMTGGSKVHPSVGSGANRRPNV